MADGQAALIIQLSNNVNLFNPGVASVEAILAYQTASLPGAAWLVGSGLLSLLAFRRK